MIRAQARRCVSLCIRRAHVFDSAQIRGELHDGSGSGRSTVGVGHLRGQYNRFQSVREDARAIRHEIENDRCAGSLNQGCGRFDVLGERANSDGCGGTSGHIDRLGDSFDRFHHGRKDGSVAIVDLERD